MPDIRLQALPQATNLDQALAVGGESIYDLLDLSPRERPDRDDVLIAHMANVVRAKREESLRAARCGNELDLHCVRGVQFHDCAQVAKTQSGVRDVMCESDGVKQLVHGSPRKYGY
jgi:hypothetical protein